MGIQIGEELRVGLPKLILLSLTTLLSYVN